MIFERIIKSVAAHLTTELGNISVVSHPASDNERLRSGSATIVTVLFGKLEAENFTQTGGPQQDKELDLDLLIEGPNLYSEDGTLDVLERVMIAIEGFKPFYDDNGTTKFLTIDSQARMTTGDKQNNETQAHSFLLTVTYKIF